MPGHGRQGHALGKARLHTRQVGLHRRFRRNDPALAEDPGVHLSQQARVVIGRPAQHDPVEVGQQGLRRVQAADPAVEDDGQARPFLLEPSDQVVVEGRNIAVLLGRQALQDRLARVDDEGVDPGARAGVHQGEETGLRVLVVHADPALHRRRNLHSLPDGGHALGHEVRLEHEAGPEAPGLHPVGGAADVQVDLAIPEVLTNPRRRRQLRWVAAPQLEGDGMLGCIEAQQPLAVAMEDGRAGDHLGIQEGATRQHPVEGPAVTVGPVHHRSDGEAVGGLGHSRPAPFPSCRDPKSPH